MTAVPPPFERVVWITGGGQQTLRTSLAHFVDPARFQTTLCGRDYRRSRVVPANDYWTDRDCVRCTTIAGLKVAAGAAS